MHRKIYKNPNMLYRYYFIIPLCINSRGGIFEKKKMAAKMCIFHASAMANDSRHGWRKIGILRSIVRNYFRI